MASPQARKPFAAISTVIFVIHDFTSHSKSLLTNSELTHAACFPIFCSVNFGTTNNYASYRGNALSWHAHVVLVSSIVRIEKPIPGWQIEMN